MFDLIIFTRVSRWSFAGKILQDFRIIGWFLRIGHYFRCHSLVPFCTQHIFLFVGKEKIEWKIVSTHHIHANTYTHTQSEKLLLELMNFLFVRWMVFFSSLLLNESVVVCVAFQMFYCACIMYYNNVLCVDVFIYILVSEKL